MGFRVVRPGELEWVTRPADPGDAERHVADVTERAGLEHARANLWRYEPGAKGRRHRHPKQEEVFVVLRGQLTMYVGEPPDRLDAGQGAIVRVGAGLPLQIHNEGEEELLLYIHGWPPEDEHAEILDSVV